MRQGARIFLRPDTFFNQLQWSSHHWLILLAFTVAGAVETQLGLHSQLVRAYVTLVHWKFGLSLGLSLWVVMFGKLLFILAGCYLAMHLLWYVGNLIGTRQSKRVLIRRLAVVLSVFLLARSAHLLTPAYPALSIVSLILAIWGVLLAYFALQQQFLLTFTETLGVFVVAALILISLRYASYQALFQMARLEFQKITAQRSKTHPMPFPRKPLPARRY